MTTQLVDYLRKGSSITFLVISTLFAVLSGCAALRPNVPRVPSYAISDAATTSLGRAFAAQAAQNQGMSGFQVMATAHSAFATRVALADMAERTLDLQYYTVGEDVTTDLLLLRIVAAAERGVRVRMLLDDVNPLTRLFARRAMAAHRGIQARLFNPFFFGGSFGPARLIEFAFDYARLNRRMHNKLWVTDNAAAVMGSRNLGDEYFGANESANFADVDLLAAGPIVRELSGAFDTYWNSAAAIPVTAFFEDAPDATEGALVREGVRARSAACRTLPQCSWLTEGALPDALRSGAVALWWAKARFVYDDPEREKTAVASGIEYDWLEDSPDGARARSELLIMSPYFVPSAQGRRHLQGMRERGVRVAVLTNSLASTDSPAAHAAYARHRPGLVRSGVDLFELRPQQGGRRRLAYRWGQVSPVSLHAKVIVQDRARAIVGSLNQDPRSRLHNTESWVVIESAEIAGDLATLFEEGSDPGRAFRVVEQKLIDATASIEWHTEEGGSPARFEIEPMTSPWQRLWRDWLGALIPEHLL